MTPSSGDQNNAKKIVYIDEDLEEIIPGYLENREKDIRKIFDAISSNSFDDIRLIGHSMKGSGGGYGFDYITEIGSHIETAAKSKNVAEIEKRAQELKSYIKSIEIIYE